MSKIGKKIIEIPAGVTVTVEGRKVKVTGPKGNLELNTRGNATVEVNGNEVTIKTNEKRNPEYQGLYRTLVANLVKGVSEGFSKNLEFQGIGYRASVQNGDLVLNVGYSHPVTVKKVEGIDFSVNENVITVSGIDNVLVGDMAAKIRRVRPPEPYKGKGIRYQGEYIIRKQAKAAV